MGGGISKFPGLGKRSIQGAIDKAGLPLSIEGEVDKGSLRDPGQAPPPLLTEPYDVSGWFTGVKSSVTISRPSAVVYDSLKTDFHKVFSPITESEDEIQEEEPSGAQKIFRIVRIPFKVSFISGNLKMRLHIEQSPQTGEIDIHNLKEGRLISNFIATFKLVPPPATAGDSEETKIIFNSRIAAKSLPPPPFKGLVKGLMVHKIDSCMCDLVNFHGGDAVPRKSLSSRKSRDGRGGRSFRNTKGRRVSMDSATSLGARSELSEQRIQP